MELSFNQLKKENKRLTAEKDHMSDLYNTANNAALKFREDSVTYKGLWKVEERKHKDAVIAVRIIVFGILLTMVAVGLLAIYWR